MQAATMMEPPLHWAPQAPFMPHLTHQHRQPPPSLLPPHPHTRAWPLLSAHPIKVPLLCTLFPARPPCTPQQRALVMPCKRVTPFLPLRLRCRLPSLQRRSGSAGARRLPPSLHPCFLPLVGVRVHGASWPFDPVTGVCSQNTIKVMPRQAHLQLSVSEW